MLADNQNEVILCHIHIDHDDDSEAADHDST